MNSNPKLAIFDVDGTIAINGRVPQSVIDGIKHLQRKGCITTVSTGRGYIRLKEMLGDLFEVLISEDALLIIEHGSKIVRRNGEVVFGEFFTDREIDHVIDFTRANISIFKLLWFNPLNVDEMVQVWCSDEKDLDSEIKKRGHYANVFTCSIGELEDLLLGYKLTNVTLKLKDYVKVENLKLSFTRTDTNVIFQDGNMEFIKSNINKGLAVEFISRELGIANENLLVAGNAINDVEMLDVSINNSVLVSKFEDKDDILSYLSDPQKILIVASPDKLGEYLLTI